MPPHCLHDIQMNRYCYTCSGWYCYHCRGRHNQHMTQDLSIIVSLNKSLIELGWTYHGTYYNKVKIATAMLYEHYKFLHSARTIRIGSWNLQDVTPEPPLNFRLRCICHIIANYKFDIIALQEVSHTAALTLLGILNQREIEPIWNLVSHNIPHTAGRFLYKRSVLNIQLRNRGRHDNNIYHWKPVSAMFTVNDSWTFTLLNFHLRPRPAHQAENDCEVAELTQFVNVGPPDAGDLILLGDFNCIPNNAELASRGYSNIFNVREYTNSTLSETYDNILIPHKLHPRCIDHGISPTSRRRRHTIAGERYYLPGASALTGITDHYPIWADFVY